MGGEWDKVTSGTTDTVLRSMDEKDFELYIYSLRKMAENNLESNRTFMTDLYNLRAFQYKAAEEPTAEICHDSFRFCKF